MGHMLAGARGHLEHAEATLGRVHVLLQHTQDGILVPLGSSSHHHRIDQLQGPGWREVRGDTDRGLQGGAAGQSPPP